MWRSPRDLPPQPSLRPPPKQGGTQRRNKPAVAGQDFGRIVQRVETAMPACQDEVSLGLLGCMQRKGAIGGMRRYAYDMGIVVLLVQSNDCVGRIYQSCTALPCTKH